ncbi:MAG: zinc ribbon domain-containing protein [Blautia sp.]
MKCFNCGCDLPDGARFCASCGTKQPEEVVVDVPVAEDPIEEEPAPVKEAPVEEEPTVVSVPVVRTSVKFCPHCGGRNDEDAVFCCECGKNMNMDGEEEKTHRKFPVKLIGGVVGVAVVAGVAITVVSRFLGGGGDNKYVAYLKDGSVNQVDLDRYKKEPVEYDGSYSVLNEATKYEAMVQYSKDGKYIFYPTNVGYENDGYFGYRLNMQKVGKTEDEIKIDNSVRVYDVLDDNRVVYIKAGNDTLYISDKKGNKEKIASDVQTFRIDEEQKNIVWLKKEGDDRVSLYKQDLNLKKDKSVLAKDITNIYMNEGLEQIVVMDEDILYVINDFKEKEKIASNVSRLMLNNVEEKCIYYVKKDESTLVAGDLVVDDCAEADAKMEEPEYDDFKVEKIEKNNWTGKYEKVETTDYDAYNEAYDKYREKENRDDLRERIDELEISHEVQELYCYKDGKEIKIDESFAGISSNDQVKQFVYNRYNMEELPQLKLSEISYAGEIQEQYYEALQNSLQTCVYIDGKTIILDEVIDNIFTIDKDSNIGYGMKTESVATEDEDEYVEKRSTISLMSFSVDAKSDGKCHVVAEDVDRVEGVKDGNVYYIMDRHDDAGELYCNEKEIDSDVFPGSVKFLDDSILYGVDYDSSNERATLKLYDGKKDKTIADDVYSYKAFDENNVAIIVDYNTKRYNGDLKYYRGKEELIHLDEDVSAIFGGTRFY